MPGLLAPSSTFQNAQDEADLYVRKYDSMVVSPLTVVSANGLHSATATVGNTGGLALSVDSGTIDLEDDVNLNGNVNLVGGTATVFSPNASSSATIGVPNGGDLVLTPPSGQSVAVGGLSGASAVYDGKYNPVSVWEADWTSAQTYTDASEVEEMLTLTAGKYQLYASLVLSDSGPGNPVIGSHITATVQPNPIAVGVGFRWASISITPSMLITPPDGESSGATFSSGLFDVTNTAITYGFGIDFAGTWDFGPGGNLKLQLVRVCDPDPSGPHN